jgi:hypothetical protein
LVERLAKCLAGEASPDSVFWTAEFRNEARQVMLVIEEAC